MYFKRAMAKSRQSARTPDPKGNGSREIPGPWQLQLLRPPDRTNPGWPPQWNLVLEWAPGPRSQLLCKAEEPQESNRGTEKEKSEPESETEPSTLQPTTSSTMAQLQLSYQAKEQSTRLE